MVEIENGRTPQVLLLGNGLNRTYGGDSWGDLLQRISCREDLPEELVCPYPLQAVLVTNDHVKSAMKEHKQDFYGRTSEQLDAQLQTILQAGFDDILTTNYSYELEAAAAGKPAVTDYYLKKTCKTLQENKAAEGKYLIRTHQAVTCNGIENRIWHIHGESRKPDSMILGHYYYASLLHKMTSYVQARRNVYQENQKEGKPQLISSWLDSFILGDVYMLGFGMGFSEIDLWWLVNRKKREHANHGTVYFYSPDEGKFNEKEELLKLLDVEVEHCGITINNETSYDQFYQAAIADILRKMKENRKE